MAQRRGSGSRADREFIAKVVDHGLFTFEQVWRTVNCTQDRAEKILRWTAGPKQHARERYGDWFGVARAGTYEVRSRPGTTWRLDEYGLVEPPHREASRSEYPEAPMYPPTAFDPQAVSDALRRVYEAEWPVLVDYLKRLGEPTLSRPLLIDPPKRFYSQRLKLCVVGQQTYGWFGWPNDSVPLTERLECVEQLMSKYTNFDLGASSGGPFWPTVRCLEAALGIDPRAIVWSNLQKIDKEKGHLPESINTHILQRFPAVDREIVLTRPDVVVFLTGPNYDLEIRRIFPRIEFEPVPQVQRGSLLFDQLTHPLLPTKTCRTAYPSRFVDPAPIVQAIANFVQGSAAPG